MIHIKYCALTTTAASLKSFVIPSLDNLAKHGYDITVSCMKDSKFQDEVYGKFSFFPLNIDRGFNLKKTVTNVVILYKFFKKEKFQMIEYGTENVSMAASLAGWLAKVPVRIYNHWGARYVGFTGLSRFLSIWIERFTAAFSTDIRQVSSRNAQMCINQHLYSLKKVKVLGKGGTIGVDLKKFDYKNKDNHRKDIIDQYHLPTNAFIFGFVGRIQKDKGINELIQAFKMITDVRAYLILAGNIDDQNPVEETNMAWARKSDRVIFTGFTMDTPKYMSAFNVLVHPTYREGFGMVLQEAAAVKTAIITTNIMGPGEFIQNGITGILVEPKNDRQLLDAMNKLLREPSLCVDYAEKNYVYVRANFERSIMLEYLLQDREMLKKKVI